MTDESRPPDGQSTDDDDKPPDMNEAVVAEWVEDTTPFERVHATIRRTYDPASAAEIGERARVSPTTARKHLRTLLDSGEVRSVQDGQTTLYHRSETAIVTEHAQTLLEERTPEEIASGIAEMKATIREWRAAYDVESPEEYARKMDVADADSEHAAVLTEWRTTRRNLALAEAALAIGEASRTGRLSGTDADDDSDASVIV